MSIRFKAAALFGATMIAGTVVSLAPAYAQAAKYCSGSLVANSFYSNVLPATGGADVEYHGQFQNQDTKRRKIVATMISLQKIGNFSILRPIAHIDLASYEQKDIVIFSVHTTNPGGTGAPTPATVGSTIRFTCAYTQ